MTRRHFIKAAAVFGAVSPLAGYVLKEAKKPNILWITCEDIGPALGCYGDSWAHTPHLDKLASEGIVYERAYATAPICAPARSCLITGLYATSLGTQHLRSEIPRPDFIKPLPLLMRENGYFCSNNAKTDYNFSAEGLWDSWSGKAHWRDRPEDQPFFSVFNYGISHEGHGNRLSEADVAELEMHHRPEEAQVPPYFPDTETFRTLWAHYYDLITVLDKRVGELLQQLENDGLAKDTIVFFFSDHGFGLPRYKRWCYSSGLHVPFIVRIPDKYKHLSTESLPSHSDRLVSFVDFAPTTLSLTGAPIPGIMEGYPFLGQKTSKPRDYVIGARSRADDVYDVSRAVIDDRYIYVRNFMPHRPYIQDAIIFNRHKTSFNELHRLRDTGMLPPESQKMFQPKPLEELYDLQNDPYELNNIIDDTRLSDVVQTMRQRLDDWVLQTRDTGFLHEAEMMIRTGNDTVYEMARDLKRYDIEPIYKAAKLVGDESVDVDSLVSKLNSPNSGVRFWIVTALLAKGKEAERAISALEKLLDDVSASVQVSAAETLCNLDHCEKPLKVLETHLTDESQPWLQLQAARAIQCIGTKAAPIKSTIQRVRQSVSGDIWGLYKNWMYPMFIGFALDSSLHQLGEPLPERLR